MLNRREAMLRLGQVGLGALTLPGLPGGALRAAARSTAEPFALASHCGSMAVSPPARVARAQYVAGVMLLEIQATVPSHMANCTPPG